jgi:hypothetical protein
VVYPVSVAICVYLWDTTLPPPTLPQGKVRFLLPLVVVLIVTAHSIWVARHTIIQLRFHRPTTQEYLHLTYAATLLELSEDAVRARLQRIGSTTQLHAGQEYIAVDDVCDLLLNTWLPAETSGPAADGERR